ncbi:unnamed protein product [Sympodiomycopsis kandeliae]
MQTFLKSQVEGGLECMQQQQEVIRKFFEFIGKYRPHHQVKMAQRPVTPPPNASSSSSGVGRLPPATPEHVRVMQENRLKAKARIQAQAAAQYPEHRLNGSNKRPRGPVALEKEEPSIGAQGSLRSLPSTSRDASKDTSTTSINPATGRPRAAVKKDDPNAPLERDKSLGDYIEFDLSKLHNSKGGFLLEDDGGNGELAGVKTIEEIRRERERERQMMRENMEPGIVLDDREMVCQDCGSKELNDQFRKIFGIKVCRVCERKYPDKYSLLTKTEVKEDYLLTDAELRDEELLPHLLKANPHKSTYSNMMLFVRSQVEKYAFSEAKWGSEEGLDAEFQRRQDEKSRKRGKKFHDGLKELRKRTRDSVWQKRKDAEHIHTFVPAEQGEDGYSIQSGVQKQVCQDCGHTIEVEVF